LVRFGGAPRPLRFDRSMYRSRGVAASRPPGALQGKCAARDSNPRPRGKSPVLMPSQLAAQNNSRSASALGGTRTPDLLIRSQARFPLRYKGIRARRACPRQDSNLRPPGSEPGALSTAPRRPDAGVAYYDHRTAWPEERRHAHRSSWPHCPSGVRVSAGIRREPGGIRTPNRLGVNELRSHCATGPGARRDGGEPSASTARSGSMSPRRRQHDLTQGATPGSGP